LLPTEQQPLQRTTNGVVQKIKKNSLNCVSTCFWGDFLVTGRGCFEMTEKTYVNSVIMPFSVMQKCLKKKMTEKFQVILEK